MCMQSIGRTTRSVSRWFEDQLRKLRQLGWRTVLGFIVTFLLSSFAFIVLIVIVTLMCITFVKSVDQQGADFGNVPLQFSGICVVLAGLFFGGQKWFHERNKPDKDRLRIGMLYLLAGIFVAVFTFTYPAYASMATPYAAHSILLWVSDWQSSCGRIGVRGGYFQNCCLIMAVF